MMFRCRTQKAELYKGVSFTGIRSHPSLSESTFPSNGSRTDSRVPTDGVAVINDEDGFGGQASVADTESTGGGSEVFSDHGSLTSVE